MYGVLFLSPQHTHESQKTTFVDLISSSTFTWVREKELRFSGLACTASTRPPEPSCQPSIHYLEQQNSTVALTTHH